TARDEHDGTVEALDEAGRDDPDHALVPVLARDDVRAPALVGLRPLLDLDDRLAQDASFDGLTLVVQLLQGVRKEACLLRVVGQQQMERGARMTEPAGSVDARPEPEADRAGVGGGRIDARDVHQRLQSWLLRARERAQARYREAAVLVQQRDDVGDRRERNEIEMALRDVGVDAEERLPELVDDAGAA